MQVIILTVECYENTDTGFSILDIVLANLPHLKHKWNLKIHFHGCKLLYPLTDHINFYF